MTEAQQRRFYFPCWNECAVANRWLMVRGRLTADLLAQREEYAAWPEPARELYLKLVALAYELADAEHRAVVADDLRHACNLVAAGKQGSGSLDNKQTNRVVTLFKLLKDPEDLDAVMDWLHPENADRKSFVAYLKKRAPEATLIAISKNAFKTIFWEDLDFGKLKWLARQLPAFRKARAQRPEPDPELEPF